MTPRPKIGQPRFLSKDEVLTLHRASLDAYGGADGFLNEGALESALAQARQGFGGSYAHDFPFGMAEAYCFHIAMNHAFRDGNKRTAFAAMTVFLRMNGWDLVVSDTEAPSLLLDLIELKHSKAWLTDRLSHLTRLRPEIELRDFFAHLQSLELRRFFESAFGDGPRGIAQTSREAEAAMPLLTETFNQIESLQRGQGDTRHIDLLKGQLTLLAAIYRIAEDMGYEW